MRNLLFGLMALLVIASIDLTNYTARSSAGGNVASANGSGHSSELTLSFGAFDHGDSTYTGQATFINDFAKTKVTIDVECLFVNGNAAAVTGLVRKSTDQGYAVGSWVQFIVIDNGEGAGANPDSFTAPYFNAECGFPIASPPSMESDAGNIQVRFVAPDKDCTKCPVGTHCAGNGECVGGGGSHCKAGYVDCCGDCVPDDGSVCKACPK